jgi:Glycosyl transferase family 2
LRAPGERRRRRPRVSIVVPTYNRAGLLEAAIESVLEQDYPDVELIVLDDGSTDDTPDVLRRLADRSRASFRVERHPNMGFVRTLNRGFELASGEIFGLVPDDDLLRPGAISALVGALDADPDAVLAYSGYDVIDGGGETLRTVVPIEFTVAEALRLYWMTVAGPGALFHGWAYERVGGWDTELRWSSDFDFWLRLRLLGRFARLPEPLAAKRDHEGAYSVALRGPEKARDRVRLVEKMYATDGLPEDVLAVRDEAFRAAYIDAGINAAPGINGPDERFYVADRLNSGITEVPPEDLEATVVELSHANRWLERELAERDAFLASLEAPVWTRVWRRAVPDRVRELAGRIAPGTLKSLRRFHR